MILSAPTPGEWLRRHFDAYQAGGPQHRVVRYDDLLGRDDALVRQLERWRREAIPDAAGGMYLSGWFGGQLAAWTAFCLIAARAAFLPERERLSWLVHPDGWPDATVLGEGTPVLVRPDHPWAGQPGVGVVATAQEQRTMLAEAVARAAGPLIDHLQALTRAGRGGLWHEVGDGFAGAVTDQRAFPLRPEHVDEVRALADLPGAPWRRRARLDHVREGDLAYCVVQRGGCCLSYTEPPQAKEPDDDSVAFRKAFDDEPEAPRYCDDCRFRPYESCFARQSWWRRRE